MSEPLFIGIDIGTQGTKTVLCRADGKIISEAFSPSVLEQPEPGAVTEDPERIFGSVISTIKTAVEKSGADGKNVAAICADAQMAGIMGIDSAGHAVTPLDSWLDSRCSQYTELLKEKAGDACVATSGGQIINSHAPKILWWKNERPEVYEKIAKFVMPNGYVAGRLCGLAAGDAFMDYTFLHFNNFSDNLSLAFNGSMLSDFRVDAARLPKIVSPYTVIGRILPEYAAACGISESTAIVAGCGDTAASSLGAGITKPGLAYDVAGTASVFACCCDRFSPDTSHRTLLFSRSVIEGLFLPLAYVTGGGLRLKWFAELVKSDLKTLDSKAATVKPGSGGITFIPHFSGRACPLDNNASGAFTGLCSQTGESEMYRAVLEAVAFEYKGYLDIMRESACVESISAVRGVGGGAKSPVFAKIKADVLAADYLSAEHICSAPQAMAKLAAFSAGFTNDSLTEIFSSVGGENKICFDKDAHNAYLPAFERYKRINGLYLR